MRPEGDTAFEGWVVGVGARMIMAFLVYQDKAMDILALVDRSNLLFNLIFEDSIFLISPSTRAF